MRNWEEAKSDPVFNVHCLFAYTTVSHGLKDDRFRVVGVLPSVMRRDEDYNLLVEELQRSRVLNAPSVILTLSGAYLLKTTFSPRCIHQHLGRGLLGTL